MNVKFSVNPVKRSWEMILFISHIVLFLTVIFYAGPSGAQQSLTRESAETLSLMVKTDAGLRKPQGERFTISDAIAYALKNNPKGQNIRKRH